MFKLDRSTPLITDPPKTILNTLWKKIYRYKSDKVMELVGGKVGHLQPFYLCLSRLCCSLAELQDVRPEKFCQAYHPEDKNLASIYRQDIEVQNLTCIYKILNPVPHLLARKTTELCLLSGWICWKKPRRDTDIPNGSAGLVGGGTVINWAAPSSLVENPFTWLSELVMIFFPSLWKAAMSKGFKLWS